MSPTFETTARFRKDIADLSPGDQERFKEKVLGLLVPALAAREQPPPGLRVKGVQGAPGVFEMTFASDGRATFQYGDELIDGQTHIIWRRVGGHAIFAEP